MFYPKGCPKDLIILFNPLKYYTISQFYIKILCVRKMHKLLKVHNWFLVKLESEPVLSLQSRPNFPGILRRAFSGPALPLFPLCPSDQQVLFARGFA